MEIDMHLNNVFKCKFSTYSVRTISAVKEKSI